MITEKEYKRLKRNQRQRLFQRSIRNEVITHYGGKCECCGEKRTEFLTIDHKNADGAKHQKVNKSQICVWLKRNKYPKEYRILCYNCNSAIGFYGMCPHDSTKFIGKQEPDLEKLRPKSDR